MGNIKQFTTILKNWIIPKGSSGVVFIYKLQWNEEYWNEPLTFDPDRFLASEDHSKNFLAFSQAERYYITQSPDLYPIEMLWIDVNKHVKKQELKNINELCARIEGAWCFNYRWDRCIRFIESMPRRYAAVLRNKDVATKY
ncbi:hypothetical protein HZH68_015193 [Vespula germanica]|uniref:Uncharacterized protein n=1 Tax=Vespula germanica TaxID=30212 RepID=A0A834MTQ4_VESGE|nr:hypothetical protein HZH68_015193 [Vespula germanica]